MSDICSYTGLEWLLGKDTIIQEHLRIRMSLFEEPFWLQSSQYQINHKIPEAFISWVQSIAGIVWQNVIVPYFSVIGPEAVKKL